MTFWQNFNIAKLINSLIVIIFLALFINIFISFDKIKTLLHDGREESMEFMVKNIISILEYHYSLVETKQLTEAEAKEKSLNIIQNIRYGEKKLDYFWIHDNNFKMVMHPFRPDLKDKDMSQTKDSHGKYFFQEMNKVCEQSGGGDVEYYWQYYDEKDRIVPKLAYVHSFRPWHWIVGTGLYTEDFKEIVMASLRGTIIVNFFIILITLLLGFFVKYIISKRISAINKKIQEVNNAITEGVISYQITDLDKTKDFSEIEKSINAILKNFHKSISHIKLNLFAFRAGTIIQDKQSQEDSKGEFHELDACLNDLTKIVNIFNHEQKLLIDAIAHDGNLSIRAKTVGLQGFWEDVLKNTNHIITVLLAPISETSNVLQRLSDKDLTQFVRGEYVGENATLKEAINTFITNIRQSFEMIQSTVSEI